MQIIQPDEPVTEDETQKNFKACLTVPKDASYTPSKIVKGLVGPVPLTVLNYRSAEVSRVLAKLLESERFDSVQLESSHLSSYLPLIRNSPQPPPVLLDWHNIESELMSRFAAETGSLPKKLVGLRTASLLRKLEAQLVTACDFHTVVSEPEENQLLSVSASAQVSVVPNGVDSKAFTLIEKTPDADSLLFVGSMDYHANIDAVTWFIKTAWPQISRQFPQLKFKIVGRSPTPAVQMLASDRVEVTGTVADVRPYYANALAVVVPLRVGGGTRLKILEAMAVGVPVISTAIGAEGISAVDGSEILIADSPEHMANSLERIVSSPGLRQNIIQSARKLVTREYDWSAIGSRLFDLHSKLIGSRMSHSF